MRIFIRSTLLFLFISNINAAEIGVWIRLGISDTASTKWDGSVTVQPGHVTQISGWRFDQEDSINGTIGWIASTRSTTSDHKTSRSNNSTESKKNDDKSD